MLADLVGEPPKPVKKSVIHDWLESLEPEDVEWFHAQLRDPRWKTREFSRTLVAKAGVPFGVTVLQDYRKEFLNEPR